MILARNMRVSFAMMPLSVKKNKKTIVEISKTNWYDVSFLKPTLSENEQRTRIHISSNLNRLNKGLFFEKNLFDK
jgi:hypothetical protein